MSLGEAFVEVRADLRPFGRDLRRSVPPMVEAFERELNNAVGRAVLAHSEDDGRKVGDRIGRGVKRSLNEQFKTKNPFLVLAASLGSALDDGISALPTEIKAAIVLTLLAITPLLAAGITGALVAGVGAGVAGIGVLLAAQFEEVQAAATQTGRSIREIFVTAAFNFGPAVVSNLAIIETRLRGMQDTFNHLFDVSAGFLDPLVQGALNAFEELVNSIDASIVKIGPFVDELGSSFQVVGDAIGDAIEILVSTGDDGVKALRDLTAFAGALLVSIALLFKFFTRLYGLIRNILIVTGQLTGALSVPAGLITRIFNLIDKRANGNREFVNTNTDVANSFVGLIAATKGQTDALGEYKKAIQGVSDAAKSNLQLNLDWEESLDRISTALQENGKSLDIHTEKGRANIKEFINGLQVAEDRAILRVQRGELTAGQAAAQYQLEINQLKVLAHQAGISDAAFNALFQEIIDTSALRISSEEIGVTGLNGELENGVDAATRLHQMLLLIAHLGKTIGGGGVGGVKGFADGGIHHLPDIVRVAEAGPEVTIPLTRPARAAALLQESGLSSMLQSGGPGQILVFIGNEQLDSRTVRIVERSNQAQALALNHGGRNL